MISDVNWIIVERRDLDDTLNIPKSNSVKENGFTSKSGNSYWIGLNKLYRIMKTVCLISLINLKGIGRFKLNCHK